MSQKIVVSLHIQNNHKPTATAAMLSLLLFLPCAVRPLVLWRRAWTIAALPAAMERTSSVEVHFSSIQMRPRTSRLKHGGPLSIQAVPAFGDGE